MLAARYLMEQGFAIREYNWRSGHKEIDLVAQERDVLVFVEVKTRKRGGWQSAYDSIDEQKRRTLRRGATAYRALHHIRLNLQFDLIAITVDDDDSYSIEYVENIL